MWEGSIGAGTFVTPSTSLLAELHVEAFPMTTLYMPAIGVGRGDVSSTMWRFTLGVTPIPDSSELTTTIAVAMTQRFR